MKQRVINAFFEGQSLDAYTSLGAHPRFEQISGVRFSLYAPAAQSVQVIGSFNKWNGEAHFMDKVDERGIWSVFVPYAKVNDMYKYRIKQMDGAYVDKMDPFAFYSELRPNTASIVSDLSYNWDDEEWMRTRNRCFHKPLNIYEVHLGGWKHFNQEEVNYKEVASELIAYVKKMHYTHVEFMPLSEYPFDGSWGYQISGYYSVTSRYGTIQDLKYLVNELHKNGIGVIFDFVPVHFVMDNYALREFDGSHVFEYQNNGDAFSEWGTANFDLHKEEVRSFLMSAAAYWIKELHGDGLRMDAISNAIYWQGKKERGVNEGAITFIRRMNYLLHLNFPQIMLIAEDSSDFYGVSKNVENGLGFDYKWDLGWMNDTLSYLKMDPIYRKHHHNKINFSMAYFYSENYILPFSHDESVHSKATIVDKMWGSYEQKFAQARMLYVYMYTHPGKKLNFMGNEIGHLREFDEREELDWFLLRYPMHDSFQRFMKDLQRIYISYDALYKEDYDYHYFEWIDADNANENLFSFMRKGEKETLVVILNMSPNTYLKHSFGVLEDGTYSEIINSEKDIYSGMNIINEKIMDAKEGNVDYKPYYIEVDVAAFSGIIIKHVNKNYKGQYFD